MGITLRCVLVIVSVITFLYVIRKIQKSQMKIEGAIFWFLFAGLILLFSVFPGIAYLVADFLGIESPSNLIFLVIIFLLITKNFSLSLASAKLEYKLEVLTAEVAIWRNAQEKDKQ